MENSISPNIEQVRLTADDAILSKMACVDKGYYTDQYIHNFIRRKARRTPIINRGYYSRVKALEMIISRFISHYDRKCQIISLGGGYDSLLFRLHDMNLQPEMFVDLDLLETCMNKSAIIHHCPQLSCIIFGQNSHEDKNQPSIQTDHYILQPVDLTDTKSVKEFIESSNLKKDLPTLFLSECVLIYIQPDAVNPTLQYLEETFTNNVIVVYEQIRPNDPFGSMMIRNLHERGCDLVSLEKYPEIEDVKKRYKELGYSKVFCEDMVTMYTRFIPSDEIRRISRIELFDEFEEWNLLQGHYCILVASQGCIDEVFEELVKMDH